MKETEWNRGRRLNAIARDIMSRTIADGQEQYAFNVGYHEDGKTKKKIVTYIHDAPGVITYTYDIENGVVTVKGKEIDEDEIRTKLDEIKKKSNEICSPTKTEKWGLSCFGTK
ncbi:hypothetical protein AALP_AA2G028300 [Arabis alpina]|uniref:HMA domain-containing protein n=1 Tax=Arabis alpina TaxID=50452 RepID=A0A087HEY5_ARAAL|nr:hypothetical protein AALP_AA2G028300 [Arabis alpina]